LTPYRWGVTTPLLIYRTKNPEQEEKPCVQKRKASRNYNTTNVAQGGGRV